MAEEYESYMLSYEEFVDENEDELNAIFAETGADRELDFDKERRTEMLYYASPFTLLGQAYPQLVRTRACK